MPCRRLAACVAACAAVDLVVGIVRCRRLRRPSPSPCRRCLAVVVPSLSVPVSVSVLHGVRLPERDGHLDCPRFKKNPSVSRTPRSSVQSSIRRAASVLFIWDILVQAHLQQGTLWSRSSRKDIQACSTDSGILVFRFNLFAIRFGKRDRKTSEQRSQGDSAIQPDYAAGALRKNPQHLQHQFDIIM